MEELRKNMTNLDQGSRSPDRDLNQRPVEYEVGLEIIPMFDSKAIARCFTIDDTKL
jgi:hypothetical protein